MGGVTQQSSSQTRLWEFKPGSTFWIDFGEQKGSDHTSMFDLTEVVMFDVAHHLALLRVAPTSGRGDPVPPLLPLASAAPQAPEGRRVYIVGYPARDLRVDPEMTEMVFRGAYEKKRLQPGQILAVSTEEPVFWHDCFTLGGNGGAPVVDLETGEVIGLHFAGHWFEYKRGEATALWMLPQLRSLTEGGGP